MTRLSHDQGFTLVELMVATMLTMTVMAGVLMVLAPSQGMFAVQPEVSDTQQRLRVGVSSLTRELILAGAGAVSPDGGALSHYLAPLRPYRIGDIENDARAGVHYRPNTISIIYVPPMPVTSSRRVAAGGNVVETVTHTFYVRDDPRTGASQLMHYDGAETDLPVLDDVVGLRFEYFADPQPPAVFARAAAEVHASYGPTPPPPWRDDPADSWGAGENCTFSLVDGVHHPRLAALAPGAALVALTPALLTDGPWCPDSSNAERFDADLLRIRRVGVWLRVQASASFRGPVSTLFMRGGTATGATRMVPDQEILFNVSPRNMNLAR